MSREEKNEIVLKIGGKGFKSYYLPAADFLNQEKKVRIMALGKRVQMGCYLAGVLKDRGARIIDMDACLVKMPKPAHSNISVDIIMVQFLVEKSNFVPIIFEKDENQ